MSGKRSDPDKEFFREAMSDVRPLENRARVLPEKRKPPARARFTAADRAMVLVESLQGVQEDAGDVGDEISFRRAGVQDGVMRKLKRGEYRVEEVCDLHGLRVAEAKAALREFLAESLARNLRCVRIIHGKGLHSDSRVPTLKNLVDRMLRQRADVLAFHSAPAAQGGGGAVLVLLAKR